MIAYVSILSVLLLLVLAVVCVDAWRFLGTLAGRFHIGRWQDRRAWQEALARTAAAWTRRMPAVPKRDQGQAHPVGDGAGNLRGRRHSGWQAAGLFLGLHVYAADRKDEALKERLRHSLEEHELVRNCLGRSGAGTVGGGPAAAGLCRAGGRMPRADQVAEASAALLESLRTGAGTLAYRRRQPGVRYVDAIGLACPLGGRLRGTYGKRGILEPGGEAGGGI